MHAVPNPLELEKLFEESFEKDPNYNSWGFFAYDDTPGVTGGGAGNFSWFDSKAELVSFITKFPLLAHSSVTADADRFEKAANFISSLKADDFDQKSVDELNKINSGIEQIQWFGQMKDLLEAETEFAQGMRTFFAKSPKKLPKTEIPEFGEFLRNWGH